MTAVSKLQKLVTKSYICNDTIHLSEKYFLGKSVFTQMVLSALLTVMQRVITTQLHLSWQNCLPLALPLKRQALNSM